MIVNELLFFKEQYGRLAGIGTVPVLGLSDISYFQITDFLLWEQKSYLPTWKRKWRQLGGAYVRGIRIYFVFKFLKLPHLTF